MSKFNHSIETQPQGQMAPSGSKFNPVHWSRKWKIIGAVGVIAIIVAVIVGAVVGTEESGSSSYPDYSPLNYTISERMNGTTFFDHFDYFDKTDPSSGNVVYLSADQAAYSNLTYAGENSAILRVDDTSTGITDRNSIRVTSKNQWDTGLFVFDVIHSPYGCGTWPAVWLSDPNNWPEHGEIDVIEAVEQGNKGNQMTLHTSKGCTMKTKRKETGTVSGTNCWNSTNDNEGCGVKGAKSSYGAALNEAGGAVSVPPKVAVSSCTDIPNSFSLWSSATQVFACGHSAGRTRRQISFHPTTPRLIHRNGAHLSQTSLAPIATSPRISRISPSSPTLIYAAVGQVQPVCTQQSTDVQALVQILSRTMPQHSRMPIGSSQVSEFGQLHRYCFC